MLCDGDFPYYSAVKRAYTASEWPPIYQSLLGKVEKHNSGLYTVLIFQHHIEQKAASSSTRKQYQEVCRTIKKLQKVAGSAAAEPVTQVLLASYPNKSAFKDELTHLLNTF